ncbi:DUF6463 family protein [Bailinhaonella thermotolerans]|uniref:DUF3995 domain-containing protein n=1 Tax=Bailinhaonella thermotolerans TaxID=1070861 RepID=A0A3A4B1G3_9ACTN|nr:DUF6463 family protein [Bailinhaonella thermotolerans]RJL31943.1 hypothetical protein D5H75_15980 [Bailinhaonella thermotolerans]
MSTLTRWVPRLIFITSAFHFVWAFAQRNAWAEIARGGFFATAADPSAPGYDLRDSTVWFMVGGIALLALGALTRHVARVTGRIPAQIGWFFVAMGIPLTVIYFPVTGGWAVLAIGVVALLAARRAEPRAASAP